jgi:hypothetical protein
MIMILRIGSALGGVLFFAAAIYSFWYGGPTPGFVIVGLCMMFVCLVAGRTVADVRKDEWLDKADDHDEGVRNVNAATDISPDGGVAGGHHARNDQIQVGVDPFKDAVARPGQSWDEEG